ncbi:MAG: GTP-binding protein, partial [Clostridia bacterium]|nr:GTP-binding protein [Clostridia bacterium]
MTKIDIFSGFLGAGKTTLIKKLITEAYSGERVVLIENEFGEIGIDGGFLADAGIEITEMNSGCICCSLVGDFTKALEKVIVEYSPDRIIIEPSGVGKLSDVIRAAKKVESDKAQLNAFTTVADVKKCKMYMKNFGEFYNDQIANASCIVLSHTQSANDAKIAETVALLREHNPEATIVTTPWDKLDGKDILAAMEKRDTLEDALARLEEEHKHHHEHHHEHGEECHCHEHHHDHDEECHCHEHHHEHDEECHCHEHHHEHDEECHCHEHHHEHDEECHCHEHHHDHDEECHCHE